MSTPVLRVRNQSSHPFIAHPLTRGIPLPPDWAVLDPAEVSLRDESGRTVPAGLSATQRRPDESIEWLVADLSLDLEPQRERVIDIVHEPAGETDIPHPVQVDADDDRVVLTNGLSTIELGGGAVVRRLVLHGRELIATGDQVDLETVDMDGRVYRASVDGPPAVRVERASALLATVRVDGVHRSRNGKGLLDYTLRFTLTAGRPDVKVMHTFYTRQPEQGILTVKAVRMVLRTGMARDSMKLLRQKLHTREYRPRAVEIREDIEILASSIGEVNEAASTYVTHGNGTLFLRSLDSLNEDASGFPAWIDPKYGTTFRANISGGSGCRQIHPFLGWRDRSYTLLFAMRWWHQLHPKSVRIDENVMTISFWPEWCVPMEVTQGVSKSHTFWFTAEPRALSVDELEIRHIEWEHSGVDPVDQAVPFDWLARCEVLDCHHFPPYDPDGSPLMEELLSRVVPGEPTRFTYPRNAPNGMFNFGDSDTGAWQGYTNNEDDVQVLAPIQMYLRTGQMYAWDYATERAEHYMEVDHVEWSSDPRRHGGLIPHAYKHFFGEVYPSHQWPEGILNYYYLTGDERARDVVIKAGENAVYWANNLLHLVTTDGREAGVPLVNLAFAHRVTHDSRYLDAAWVIIENFHKKWYDQWGELKYPVHGLEIFWQTGYGDWSSYYGLYRVWEQGGDERVRDLLIRLLRIAVTDPARFSRDDPRAMDFFAVWAYLRLTDDESVLETLDVPIRNMIAKGGHPLRRLHFLGDLTKRGDARLAAAGQGGMPRPAAHWHSRPV